MERIGGGIPQKNGFQPSNRFSRESVGERLNLSHPGVGAIYISGASAGIKRDVCGHNIRRIREVEPIQRFRQLSLRVVDLNAASGSGTRNRLRDKK